MDAIRKKVSNNIQNILADKTIHVNSAIDLLKLAMQQAGAVHGLSGKEKQELVIDVLADIAKGADGIEGTADDQIPPKVIAGIKAMADFDLVASTIDIIIDASNGKLHAGAGAGTCVSLLHFASCIGAIANKK